MLSLVSCVCLGMSPGMWIVSIGIYLGVQVWSFSSWSYCRNVQIA